MSGRKATSCVWGEWPPSQKVFPSYLIISGGASFDQIIRSHVSISMYSTYRLAALSTEGQASCLCIWKQSKMYKMFGQSMGSGCGGLIRTGWDGNGG